MRRILVTGASGFAGGHLRLALRAAFPGVVLVAATRGERVEGWDEAVTLDLEDPPSCIAAVHTARPDAVVHLAALAETAASFRDPQRTWRVNLLGTLAVAEAVLAEAPGAVFVLASSAEVYGLSFQDGHALAEDGALRPANPYAASKAAADLAVGEMALRGLRAIRLRPFNHTGAGQTDGFVVSAFARQVAMVAAGRQEPVLRVGALDRWRDFLDVADVCSGYIAALRRADDLPRGAVFNLASGEPRHVRGILDDLIRMAGISPRIEQDSARLRPTDVVRTEGDARAARSALGWEPRVPWATTLATVLADWQARIG
ncbi:NAD-dependent epimerase/dehydratase family protein [Falsiroseomonas oryziterrae]|uniref:NAD-dependent epimerase/dehydratase family protein n=1 Tax=Falsiroseomonas oryziterrae TaxID=2911368 RepID=UPI001F17989D|nr:NAD-dependent epimerase/dehydratase family protein [Roseomonas sp. NPKOSM-4]